MCFILLVADLKQSIRGACWSPGDSMELPGPLGESPNPGIHPAALAGKVCAESVELRISQRFCTAAE